MLQENTKLKQFETLLHLTDIYAIQGDIHDNNYINLYENLQKRFQKVYSEAPTHFVHVPGSINLFSSITSKLSFNIAQDIVIAFCMSKDQIVVNTTCSMIYPQFSIPIDPQAKIMDEESNKKQNDLIKAFCFGYKSAFMTNQPSQGFKCMISINEMVQKIGYGFHSAISIGAALVGLHVNQMNMHKIQLLNSLSITKEQLFQKDLKQEYSQILNLKNFLMLNDNNIQQSFKLQNWDQVYTQFLQNHNFIIADSLTPEPKLITFSKRMAKRQIEVILGNRLLRKKLNLNQADETIIELQDLLEYSDEDMLNYIRSNIQPLYKSEEIEKELGAKIDSFISQVPYSEQLQFMGMTFNLEGQMIHHFKENIRIKQTISILQSMSSEENKAQLIGKLMDESFSDSLNYLEIEAQEIKDLQKQLKLNKALGVKLIGTEWGGALVALFSKEITSTVVTELQDQYYSDPKRQMMISDDLSLYAFQSQPSIGAVYLDPQYEIWF